MGDLAHVHEFPLAAGQGARPIQLAEDVFRWAAATTWQRTLPLLAGLQGVWQCVGPYGVRVGYLSFMSLYVSLSFIFVHFSNFRRISIFLQNFIRSVLHFHAGCVCGW